MIEASTLSKATKIRIIPTYISKNKVQHFSIIFCNIPYINKDHRMLYSEVFFHDCTFMYHISNLLLDRTKTSKYNIAINKKCIIINKAQSFLFNTQFTFEYHEKPSTTKLITIQYPKED